MFTMYMLECVTITHIDMHKNTKSKKCTQNTHTDVHQQKHKNTHTLTCTLTQTYKQTKSHTCKHTWIYIKIHRHIQTHTDSHVGTQQHMKCTFIYTVLYHTCLATHKQFHR